MLVEKGRHDNQSALTYLCFCLNSYTREQSHNSKTQMWHAEESICGRVQRARRSQLQLLVDERWQARPRGGPAAAAHGPHTRSVAPIATSA